MLLHEWLQYRDKKIRRLRSQMDEQDETAEEVGEEEEHPPEAYQPPVEETARVEAAEEPAARPIREAPKPAETQASEQKQQPAQERQWRTSKRPPARTAREVLEALQPSQDLKARLEAVLARQKRLPLEEVDNEKKRPRRRRVVETREQLVERLLDPTLTLQEAALLLGVCPTTVRRYTNRGILKCFRTPGNQRRFKLSDILEFMESREREQQQQGPED